MISSQNFVSPLGEMMVSADERSVKMVGFGVCCEESPNDITELAVKQLCEYFAGERSEFSLPLDPDGTEFQKRVWGALLSVPYGEVRSYKDIAEMTGNARSCRAVGGANAKNPIVIIIPCHRIISSDGSLGGYSCGIDKKLYLLELEQKYPRKRR